MIRLLVFALLLLFSSCKRPVQADHFELRQIFKEIDEHDLTKIKSIVIDSIDNFEIKSIRKYDTVYSIANYENLNSGIWTNEIFDSAKIMSEAHLIEISRDDPLIKTPIHYWFSLPYFSKDKKSFIIYYNYYCGCLCAESSMRLYKRIKGKWVFIKSFYSVVS